MKIKNLNVTFLIIILLIINCGLINKNSKMEKTEKLITLVGTYESLQGVMNDISCYGYNIGYLTTKDNEIVICFDEMKNVDKVVCDKKLTVKGNYKTVKVEENFNSPCPAGEREIFMVSEFSCD